MAALRRAVRTAALTACILAGVASLAVCAAWLGQDELVYHPDRSSPGPAGSTLDGGVDVTLVTADGLDLAAWFVPPAPEVRDREVAVLVAPRNGGNRLGRAGLAELPPAGLLLRSPFTSLADLGGHHYPLLHNDAVMFGRKIAEAVVRLTEHAVGR